MSSPEVYADVKRIITAEAASLGLPVQWPNIDFTPPSPPSIWLTIDLAAEASEPYELGIGSWMERGSVWLHVMLAWGTGIDYGLQLRKALSNTFRFAQPGVSGLVYREHSFDPLSQDDGLWRRLSLAVAYTFSDIPIGASANAQAALHGSSAASGAD